MKRLSKYLAIFFISTSQILLSQSGWNLVSTLSERNLYSVFFTDVNTGYIAGGFGTGKIFKTVNGGSTWLETTFPCFQLNSVFFINSNVGWTVGANGSIYKTTNAGVAWTLQTSGTTQTLNSVHFVNENAGWVVGMNSTILKTTNGGIAWFPQTFGGSGGDHLYYVRFVDVEVGYAGGNAFAIKTTNSGLEWTHVTKVFGFPVTSIFFVDYFKGFAVNEQFIFKTTDGAINWSWFEYSTSLFSIYFIDSNRGWISGNLGSILRTTDGGTTWLTQRSGTEYFRSIFFLNPINGWVVGEGADGGKVFRTTTGGFLNVDESNNLPTKFILYQNYPNPFNPSTIIKFGIPEFANVNITIYNLLGEKIEELFNGELQPGNHEKLFNTKNLPTGVYICSLKASSIQSKNIFIKNQKLLLLK